MANTYKILIFVLAFIINSLLLTGCHQNVSNSSTITVQAVPITKELYFSGVLQPNSQTNIPAPVDGIVTQQNFTYGQPITKGQSLFIIQASKEKSDFENAFSGYLKAKESLNTSSGNLQDTAQLYQKGLVSRDEYNQAKSTYYLDQLAMIQAKDDLITIMQNYNMSKNLLSLSINDVEAIKNAMAASNSGSTININSPLDGVALFPTSTNSSTNEKNTISVGSEVKLGQVLVTIGQYKGLAMQAQVNEININQITKGMPVTITGDAFPNITLQGTINEVDSQATSAGNLPTFNMHIIIPELSPEAKKEIRIGMSAKATVTIQLANKISIPINAVFQKNGQSYVNKLVDGKTIATPVITGETTPSEVTVVNGLNAGDKIVLSH